MSDVDFASGIGYNALQPTLADTPIIPFADLAVTNPPETPLPIALQGIPVIAALSAQGQGRPVLLKADGAGKLLTSADSDQTGLTSGPQNAGDTVLNLYSTAGFLVGRSILWVPLNGLGVLTPTVERHLIKAVTATSLTLDGPLLNGGVTNSLVVEIPDVQTPPAGRILATGLTAVGTTVVHVPVTERMVALGFVFGSFGDLVSLSCIGTQSGSTYVPISVANTPGLYIFPIAGGADTDVKFTYVGISTFDTFTVIGYETVPNIYVEDRALKMGSGFFRTSYPAANTIASVSWGGGFPFGTTITDITATLRNGGGAASAALLTFTPNLLFPLSITQLADMSISAVNGDRQRVELRGLALPVELNNGSSVQFSVAGGANNFESLTVHSAIG